MREEKFHPFLHIELVFHPELFGKLAEAVEGWGKVAEPSGRLGVGPPHVHLCVDVAVDLADHIITDGCRRTSFWVG